MHLREFLKEILHDEEAYYYSEIEPSVSFAIAPDLTQLTLESDNPITLGASELQALAKAFNTDTISIPEWERIKIASGDTDDYDWHRLTVILAGGQALREVEARLDEIIAPLRQERKEAAEERERAIAKERAEAELRWAEEEADRKRKKLQKLMNSEQETLNHKWGLEAFNTYKDAILETLLQEFRPYANIERKTLAVLIKDNPIRNFIFALHSGGRCAGDPKAAFTRITMKESDKSNLGRWWKNKQTTFSDNQG